MLAMPCSNKAVSSPSVTKEIWFRKSVKRLLTGVADSISTRVFTPSRMIFRISRSYRVSLPWRGDFLLRKLCDSSITTRS